MSTTKQETITKYIAKSVEDGVTKDDIVVGLFTDHAMSLNGATKEVAKYMKDNGLTVVRIGFTAQYHEWLLEATAKSPRTVAQAEKYMKEHGSANTWKHRNYFLNERALVELAFKKGLESAKA